MEITRVFAIAMLMMAILTNTASAASTFDCKPCHTDEYTAWQSSEHYSENGTSFVKPDPETCIYCHLASTPRLYATMYGEVSAESPECEMCHQPPANGFTTHITTPSEAVPPLNLSAEICEECHTKPHHIIYKEWNEYNKSDYNPLLMKSHSEPAETEMQNKSSESRITCAMCHEPHSSELRMESQELCESCHNSNNLNQYPEGSRQIIAGGPQWEMYNGSIYTNDVHSVNLECIDCHMATITDESGGQKLVTGHSFNFDPVLLSDPDSGNKCKKCHVTGHEKIPESGDCDECHDVSLSNITLNTQETTASKLQELEILQENASNILLMPDENLNQDELTEDYKKAVSYIEFVKADGSLGMHNAERTEEYLEKAEIILRSITGEESYDTDDQETDIAGNEEQNENTIPDAGIIGSILIISIAATVMSISKKKRGK